ncbi:CLUMA_CG003260, isoform A [Clunio marinus]|uniref:CLUMA_CG003260, isoform A n=1 Tax=Clunio marinus TaxID=568069 RepID=A0A1J1HSY7_9DIPT|nr:CLUMA_CG003260, isoform A [Clunio marinus]
MQLTTGICMKYLDKEVLLCLALTMNRRRFHYNCQYTSMEKNMIPFSYHSLLLDVHHYLLWVPPKQSVLFCKIKTLFLVPEINVRRATMLVKIEYQYVMKTLLKTLSDKKNF